MVLRAWEGGGGWIPTFWCSDGLLLQVNPILSSLQNNLPDLLQSCPWAASFGWKWCLLVLVSRPHGSGLLRISFLSQESCVFSDDHPHPFKNTGNSGQPLALDVMPSFLPHCWYRTVEASLQLPCTSSIKQSTGPFHSQISKLRRISLHISSRHTYTCELADVGRIERMHDFRAASNSF